MTTSKNRGENRELVEFLESEGVPTYVHREDLNDELWE